MLSLELVTLKGEEKHFKPRPQFGPKTGLFSKFPTSTPVLLIRGSPRE